MTNCMARLRPILAALLIPVGGIAIAYTVLIDMPLRTQTIAAQTKVTKLAEAVEARSPEHAAKVRALEQAVQDERELNHFVSMAAQTDAAVAQSSAAPLSPVIQSNNVESPVSALSATLSLLSRHHLECLASEPGDESTDRYTVRVTLQGSFEDMHRALEEMQSAPSCVSILSLEMEASADSQTTHRWILILLV